MHSTPSDGDPMPNGGFRTDSRSKGEWRAVSGSDGEKGDASDCNSTPARRGRQRASTWSRQNTISKSTGGGNISTPVVGSDRLRLRLRVCDLQGRSWQRPKDGSVGVVWTLERRTTAELQFQRNETMDGTGKARQGIAAVAIYLQVPDVCAFARPKATNRQRKWKKALQTKSCSFLHRQLERCLGLPLLRCVAYENPLRDSCCLPSPPGTLESTRHLM